MKKVLFVALLLYSGIQISAMSEEEFNVTGCCCIAVSEVVRVGIRSEHSKLLPENLKKSVSSLNPCTICAMGCCLVARPETIAVGLCCSVAGCCTDSSFRNHTENHNARCCGGDCFGKTY